MTLLEFVGVPKGRKGYEDFYSGGVVSLVLNTSFNARLISMSGDNSINGHRLSSVSGSFPLSERVDFMTMDQFKDKAGLN